MVVPVPAPSRLISEHGMFIFAEGNQEAHAEGHDLRFEGIRFEGSPIDVPDMTHFHLNVHAPVGSDFEVKLDIPLADFMTPEDRDLGNVGQRVLSPTNAQLVLLDNIHWHK